MAAPRNNSLIYIILDGEKIGFTPQEKIFCSQYIKCQFNGGKAATAAGYSQKTSMTKASQLLRKVHIKRYIDFLQNDLAARCDVSAEMILLEMKKIAFANIKNVVDDRNGIRNFSDMDDEHTAAIGSVEVEEIFQGNGGTREVVGYNKKVKLLDKQRALEAINKMLGFNKPELIAETDPDGKKIDKQIIRLSNGDKIDLS